jgi:phosphoglycolate phosphatase/pyrophosphatase PpaX
MKSKRIKAVLFDWNGVVVDDLALWGKASCYAAKKLFGVEIPYEFWLNNTTQHWVDFYKPFGAKDRDEKRIFDCAFSYYVRHQNTVKIKSDTRPYLDKFKEIGLRMGVLSNTLQENITYTMEKFMLTPFFSFVLAYEDVVNHKPHPEGLLKASELLALEPQEILFVDDMPPVHATAKELGFQTVGYRSIISGQFTHADYEAESFEDIFNIIGSINS